MKVEVVYGTASRQELIALEVEDGCTVEEAIAASGIKSLFPEMQVAPDRVGIFSKRTTLDTPLRAGDRVEIYRELICDPKAKRKNRAQSAA